jgi:phage terminase large subunit
VLIEKEINPRFEDYIFDWDYEQYLLVGGYGSSKSYNTGFKLICKLLEEKRKALVVREVFDTLKESCFDLLCEILDDMNLLADENTKKAKRGKVVASVSPMQLKFPNGSRIIFKGMDKPRKLKSINGVSIVWLEECSEIKYDGYKELLGRLRTPDVSIHFILTTNPVGIENWVYTHFFKWIDEQGREHIILDDERLYQKHTIVKNGIYYHHSLPDDNVFLPKSYMRRLDEIKEYDPDLYRVARQGRFGVNGILVLPQLEIARDAKQFKNAVKAIPRNLHFRGMDFGFEISYNALVWMAVDDEKKILYIYKEYYKNKMTDDKTADELEDKVPFIREELITADCAEPKTIKYYRDRGWKMRACKKFAGSRLANTKKVKRFKKIIVSPACTNTIRELKNLTYAKDSKGNLIYDEFNIDPHTFSAIWYGLDKCTVADIKERKFNSKRGAA